MVSDMSETERIVALRVRLRLVEAAVLVSLALNVLLGAAALRRAAAPRDGTDASPRPYGGLIL